MEVKSFIFFFYHYSVYGNQQLTIKYVLNIFIDYSRITSFAIKYGNIDYW